MENFDWNFYVFLYDDIKGFDKKKAYIHYINHGKKENRICSKNKINFDWNFYIFLYDDLKNLNTENKALKHYLNHGIKENRVCNKKVYDNFDSDYYKFLYKDIIELTDKKEIFKHYINIGINENRIYNKNINNNFNWKFYVSFYKINNINNEIEAFKNYFYYGINENRIYNKKIYDNFDYESYIEKYKDLSDTRDKINIFNHYLNNGIKEKRIYNDVIYNNFDLNFYKFLYEDLNHIVNKYDAFIHYIFNGINENRIFNEFQLIDYKIGERKLKICYHDFDYHFYISLYSDLKYLENKKKLFLHWINNKDYEEKFCDRKIYYDILKFDFPFYLKLNESIKNEINTENKAWLHWNNFKITNNKNLNKNIKNKVNDEEKELVSFNNSENINTIEKELVPLNNSENINSKNIKNKINTKKKELVPLNNSENIKNIQYKTFITFIIPTIGRKTCMNTINSLINLNDNNWKAILIFDGVKNIFNIKDDRITIVEIEKKGIEDKNNQAGFVRNIGFNYVNDSEWIGFVDDDDTLSKDYIDKLKEEINENNSIDVCIFRMIYENKFVLPSEFDKYIIKCRVGISFAIKSYIKDNILFDNNNYEDYYFLKELEYKNYKIVISPYICYFVNIDPYIINDKYDRIYINDSNLYS